MMPHRQRTTHLLLIYNRGQRWTKQNNPRNAFNMNAFVQHVYAKQQLQMGTVILLKGRVSGCGLRAFCINLIAMGLLVNSMKPVAHRVYPEFCVNVLRECKQQKLV